jgi:hypothetical protein
MVRQLVQSPAKGDPIHNAPGECMTYEKPAVQRFGSLRELTLGGGAQMQGDATNLYHRS